MVNCSVAQLKIIGQRASNFPIFDSYFIGFMIIASLMSLFNKMGDGNIFVAVTGCVLLFVLFFIRFKQEQIERQIRQ